MKFISLSAQHFWYSNQTTNTGTTHGIFSVYYYTNCVCVINSWLCNIEYKKSIKSYCVKHINLTVKHPGLHNSHFCVGHRCVCIYIFPTIRPGTTNRAGIQRNNIPILVWNKAGTAFRASGETHNTKTECILVQCSARQRSSKISIHPAAIVIFRFFSHQGSEALFFYIKNINNLSKIVKLLPPNIQF